MSAAWRSILARAIGAGIALLASSSEAFGQPGDLVLRLAVARSPGADDCPDAAALAAAINARMGAPRLAAPSPGAATEGADVVVAIERTEGRLRAVVRTHGVAAGERTIDDAGPDCAGLRDALVLLMTLYLDQGWGAPPEPSPFPVASAGARLEAGSGVALGVAGGPAIAGMASVAIAPTHRLRLAVGGIVLLPHRLSYGPGTVDVSFAGGWMSSCYTAVAGGALEIAGCAAMLVGQLRGHGDGFATANRTSRRLWLAPGLGVAARGALVGRLGWVAAAHILAPVGQVEFVVEGLGTAHRSARVAGLFELGLDLRIW